MFPGLLRKNAETPIKSNDNSENGISSIAHGQCLEIFNNRDDTLETATQSSCPSEDLTTDYREYQKENESLTLNENQTQDSMVPQAATIDLTDLTPPLPVGINTIRSGTKRSIYGSLDLSRNSNPIERINS
ncbi:hypothetical protein MMC13_003254 [Lambiella insularis]|nr:hypothetical protein [Lambiella insularis]